VKKCPKCDKTYDDTWEVCLRCRKPLINTTPSKKVKQEKHIGYGEHFSNFLVTSFIGLIVLTLLSWLISAIIPLIIPFAILLTIFTIFVYPSIKVKEKLKKRK